MLPAASAEPADQPGDRPERTARTSPRSLADDLRGRTDSEIGALLRTRPDLAAPAPGDLTSLAARCLTQAAVLRALDGLDAAQLQVLEALTVAGPDSGLAPVCRLLDSRRSQVAPFAEELWVRALVWRRGNRWHVPRPVADALGPYVAGLAPAGAEEAGPAGGAAIFEPAAKQPAAASDISDTSRDELAARIGEVDDAGRAILARLTWGPPVGRLPEQGAAVAAGSRLTAAGLLVAGPSASEVMLPRQAALVLRGGKLHRSSALRAPEVTRRTVAEAQAGAAAGSAAMELLGLVEQLVEAWGAAPPRVLRGGGLAVRDLKDTADLLGVGLPLAAFVVEVSHDAGLVTDDGHLDPAWVPTCFADDWLSRDAAHRWLALVHPWLDSVRAPHRVGTRLDSGPAVNALSAGASWPRLRIWRHEILRELVTVAVDGIPATSTSTPAESQTPTSAATVSSAAAASSGPELDWSWSAIDPTDLAERLAWRHPLRPRPVLDEALGACLQAARWLGLTGAGAPTPALALMLAGAGEDEVAAATAAYLPQPVEHVVLQADLTAVVPGRPAPALASLLRSAAVPESRGGASVYRFTAESVRRHLDRGHTGTELLTELADRSATPVPQPLEYLVGDVARRHGAVRVGGMGCYVTCEDPAVLDELAAARELAGQGVRRLAPTVLVSVAEPTALLEAIRATGAAPLLESWDGSVQIVGREPARTRRRGAAVARITGLDGEAIDALIRAMRAGQQRRQEAQDREDAASDTGAEGAGPRVPASEPGVVVDRVREAIAGRDALWIGLADAAGIVRRELFWPERIEGGSLVGTVEGRGQRRLALHRITGALPRT